MSDGQVKNICAGALFVSLRGLRQIALPLLVNHQADNRIFDDQLTQVHLAVKNGNDLYSDSGVLYLKEWSVARSFRSVNDQTVSVRGESLNVNGYVLQLDPGAGGLAPLLHDF